jgi:hypothetical protein
LLRKVAILNRVTKRIEASKAMLALREHELSRQTAAYQQTMSVPRARSYSAPIVRLPRLPITRSPLVGVSNYDALDDEDMSDPENGDGDNDVYSDWKKMEPCRAVEEDEDEYGYLDELDGIPHELAELRKNRPPPPPDERMLEMMRVKEKQSELVSSILSHSAGIMVTTGSTFVGRLVEK